MAAGENQLSSAPPIEMFLGPGRLVDGQESEQTDESEGESPAASGQEDESNATEADAATDDETEQGEEGQSDGDGEKEGEVDWEARAKGLERGNAKLDSKLQSQEARFAREFKKLSDQLEALKQQQAEEDPFEGRSDEDLLTVSDIKKVNAKGGKRGGEDTVSAAVQAAIASQWVELAEYDAEGAQALNKFISDEGIVNDPGFQRFQPAAKMHAAWKAKYEKDIDAVKKAAFAEGQKAAAKRKDNLKSMPSNSGRGRGAGGGQKPLSQIEKQLQATQRKFGLIR
jgi:hypothetical protein